MKQIEENFQLEHQLKFKNVIYTKEDRMKYGVSIPEEIQVIGEYCFEYTPIQQTHADAPALPSRKVVCKEKAPYRL